MAIAAPSIRATTFVNISTTTIFALPGALATTFLVYSISNIRGKIAVIILFLSDIALRFMFSSTTSFILMFQSHSLTKAIFWLMNGLAVSVSSFKKIPDAGIYRR